MPTGSLRSVTPTIDIYIKLAQYPTLSEQIRVRMREELFRRGIIDQPTFEVEVKQKALESQRREGLNDPFGQEEANLWQKRKDKIREVQTDAYFANNLGSTLLDQIIDEVLSNQPNASNTTDLTFNPEIAPWELLFRQGEIYESLPPPEQEKIAHHLEEIKVVLIKNMISDQLPFIGVAKKVFDIADLRRIYKRRIGSGKIGGKAAGMALAWKILQQGDPQFGPDLSQSVGIPDSFFIGTEVIYEFRQLNNLDHYMNEKYRPLDEVRAKYSEVLQAHRNGRFPDQIIAQLRNVLDLVGDSPLIVRSSSLLEDNFGFSFAGKYSSYFLPNQGTPDENLAKLLDAIKRVYASTGNPDAILYRQKNGLIDYDERMAILLQRLRGKKHGRYFYPSLAGVGFSQNPFRWHPKIRREDGFLRMVWGIGTRAVDRVASDYPRLISLSHPQLRPETTTATIRQYSQWFVDVIDLEENSFKSLPIHEVMDTNFPNLRQLVSIDKGEFLQEPHSLASLKDSSKLVLTFNSLLRDRKFVKLMRTALRRLESTYNTPVDTEFTVEIIPNYPYPDYKLHILQCRPLSQREEVAQVSIPNNIPPEDVLFRAADLVPYGKAEGIRYIISVDPIKYYQIENTAVRLELGRAISRLNKRLEGEKFILMGPGRWGSTNIELGVKVSYADIHNTKVLIEVGIDKDGQAPELSYGTHFFQDLVEASIYSLPLPLSKPNNMLDWSFFRNSTNCLPRLSPQDADLVDYITVLDVAALKNNRRLTIIMDGDRDEAIAYFESGNWPALDLDNSTVSHF